MIKLGDVLRKNIDTALDRRKAIVVAYVDRQGKPHASFYGSLHVHGDDEMALWVRKPAAELPSTLPTRPDVSIIYGDLETRTYYWLYGRARLARDDAERNRVYDEMHAFERRGDAERKGVAIVIALDKVTGLENGTGMFEQKRD